MPEQHDAHVKAYCAFWEMQIRIFKRRRGRANFVGLDTR